MNYTIIALILIATVGSTLGQTRTVTNKDLEKFKQKRLAAERDYRENYAKWGFPSPEELEREREESVAERQRLSAQLRQNRLELERAEAERAFAQREAAMAYSTGFSQPYYYPYAGTYIYSGIPYGFYGTGFGYYGRKRGFDPWRQWRSPRPRSPFYGRGGIRPRKPSRPGIRIKIGGW